MAEPMRPPRTGPWPEPLEDVPSMEEVWEWLEEGRAEATDGCWVELDGVCEHGYPSWLLYRGCI